jgi:hypothetical protein
MWDDHLDDALAGVTTPRFSFEYMNTAHNPQAVSSMPPDSGPNRIATFARRAGEWCDRLAQTDPELPFPAGVEEFAAVPLTVAWFAGGGALEWHIHAWDFASVVGEEYRPSDAKLLNESTAPRFGVEPTTGDPWEQVLRSPGRRPGWATRS